MHIVHEQCNGTILWSIEPTNTICPRYHHMIYTLSPHYRQNHTHAQINAAVFFEIGPFRIASTTVVADSVYHARPHFLPHTMLVIHR